MAAIVCPAGITQNINILFAGITTMRSEWVETASGNRISKDATLNGTKQISIGEKCTISPGVVITGDVATDTPDQSTITLGKYCFLDEGCSVVPAETKHQGVFSAVYIGNYTVIGKNTKVRLAQVGNRVCVGDNCILGDHSIISDCCRIADGTIIPPKAVIPPYSEVSGVPGHSHLVEGISPGYRKLLENNARLRQVQG